MNGVEHLSCGDRKCVYGKKEGAEDTYTGCQCIPYPKTAHYVDPVDHDAHVEKIKSAKWAMHHLRRENKRLTKEVSSLWDDIHQRNDSE